MLWTTGTCVFGSVLFLLTVLSITTGAHSDVINRNETPSVPINASPVNSCLPISPCKNNATCQSSSASSPNISVDVEELFRCTCATGWTGQRCDVDVNECAGSAVVCHNGATCEDLPGTFQCYCKPGYLGNFCEIEAGEWLVKPASRNESATTSLDKRKESECTCDPSSVSHTFSPTKGEVDQGIMKISYHSTSDSYTRPYSSGKRDNTGFATWAFLSKNVARVYENDHKFSYLARAGVDRAQIAWKFDCSGTDKNITSIRLEMPRTTFSNGIIQVSVKADGRVLIDSSAAQEIEFFNLRCKNIIIMATLTNGIAGDTQLFRESSNGWGDHPLLMEVRLG